MEASTVVCVGVEGMHTYSVTYTISQSIRVCVCILHGRTLFSASAFALLCNATVDERLVRLLSNCAKPPFRGLVHETITCVINYMY